LLLAIGEADPVRVEPVIDLIPEPDLARGGGDSLSISGVRTRDCGRPGAANSDSATSSAGLNGPGVSVDVLGGIQCRQ
jgi:hypothetical protein